MICQLCGHSYDFYYDAICRECPRCYHRYEKFRKDLPESWKKVIGGTSLPPGFEEWQAEQFIKKRLFDGEITEGQAKQEALELSERIRKRYNPTPQELAERRAGHKAKREKSFFDMPSLL